MVILDKVSKSYDTKAGAVPALQDIELEVKSGEIFGVIGRSGAGKSTLIRCVNLLERPTSGRVIVDNQVLTALSNTQLRQARHRIGMVFQHFNLLHTRTVYQNIAFPLELLKISKTDIYNTVMPLLELTGLLERKDAYPSQLSGGQKQRVAIARALATKPNVLLCDEMTSSLDPETTLSILSLIKNINEQMELSILLITHEMDVIKRIADKVAVIEQGRIIENTDVVSLFKNPQTTTAQRFIQSVFNPELPQILKKHLQPDFIPNGRAILRMTFTGGSATEPVMYELIKQLDVSINILQADLEFLHRETIGMMIFSMQANANAIEKTKQFLSSKDLHVEVLGYVGTNDWVAG